MVRVLIIKTSSLGDIIHTLPALSDAIKIFPDVEFDWVVEESFQEIPSFHPAVKKVIPIALRRWRKNIFAGILSGEMLNTFREIRRTPYDKIIDAQGLLKSALLAFFSHGPRAGLGFGSTRDSLAPLFYQQRSHASWSQHAVSRIRKLFAESLGYREPTGTVDYGIDCRGRSPCRPVQSPCRPDQMPRQSPPYLVFLHGTSWPSKHWGDEQWLELSRLAIDAGYQVRLLWGSEQEKTRAMYLQAKLPTIKVEDKLSLSEIVEILSKAEGVVSVDTGLGHLAAALNIPTVSLYGPTDPNKTGTFGKHQVHLSEDMPCRPCFARDCSYKEYQGRYSACLQKIVSHTVFNNLLSAIKGASSKPVTISKEIVE